MKRIKYFLIAVIMLLPFLVHAEDLDINKIGSVKINYKYGETLIPGADASLYKVASINEDYTYTFLEGISTYSLDNITSSELAEISDKIKGEVKQSEFTSLRNCTTGTDGTCTFDNVPVGIYLIDVNSIKIGKTTYSSLPTLIIVPTTLEDSDTLLYDTEIFIKVEAETEPEEDKPVTPPDDKKDVTPQPRPYTPNTVDNILFYAMLLGISLIIIIIVIMIINKRKDDKNEKNN